MSSRRAPGIATACTSRRNAWQLPRRDRTISCAQRRATPVPISIARVSSDSISRCWGRCCRRLRTRGCRRSVGRASRRSPPWRPCPSSRWGACGRRSYRRDRKRGAWRRAAPWRVARRGLLTSIRRTIVGRRLRLDLRRFGGGDAIRLACPGAEIDELAPLRAKRAPALGRGPRDTRAATGQATLRGFTGCRT